MLKIQDLNVTLVDNTEILKNINLEIQDHTTHIIMGPNGAGKSSLCKAMMKHPAYNIKKGSVIYNNQDLTNSKTNEIASAGIYYINQTPIEIEGLTNAELLRTVMLDRGLKMDIFTFNKKCNEICQRLDLPKSFLHRNVNEGMSGGERKKNELFGMWLLSPSLIILDEIDSGLDVDALKIVAQNLKDYQQETEASLLIITHQQKLIDMLNPDYVHIMVDGTIVDSGNISLAKNIEKNGFSKYLEAYGVKEDSQNE